MGFPQVGASIYERAVMLDTGPLISLFDPSDQARDEVRETFRQIAQRRYPAVITQIVVAEAHNRILRDVNYDQACRFLDVAFDGSLNFEDLTTEDAEKAVDIILRYQDQAITFTDASSMAIMLRLGIDKVLTNDLRHFSLLNFTVVPPLQ